MYFKGFEKGYNVAFGSVVADLKKQAQENAAQGYTSIANHLSELADRYHDGEHLVVDGQPTKYAKIVAIAQQMLQLEEQAEKQGLELAAEPSFETQVDSHGRN